MISQAQGVKGKSSEYKNILTIASKYKKPARNRLSD